MKQGDRFTVSLEQQTSYFLSPKTKFVPVVRVSLLAAVVLHISLSRYRPSMVWRSLITLRAVDDDVKNEEAAHDLLLFDCWLMLELGV